MKRSLFEQKPGVYNPMNMSVSSSIFTLEERCSLQLVRTWMDRYAEAEPRLEKAITAWADLVGNVG
jgi:hypothetical protein